MSEARPWPRPARGALDAAVVVFRMMDFGPIISVPVRLALAAGASDGDVRAIGALVPDHPGFAPTVAMVAEAEQAFRRLPIPPALIDDAVARWVTPYRAGAEQRAREEEVQRQERAQRVPAALEAAAAGLYRSSSELLADERLSASLRDEQQDFASCRGALHRLRDPVDDELRAEVARRLGRDPAAPALSLLDEAERAATREPEARPRRTKLGRIVVGQLRALILRRRGRDPVAVALRSRYLELVEQLDRLNEEQARQELAHVEPAALDAEVRRWVDRPVGVRQVGL